MEKFSENKKRSFIMRHKMTSFLLFVIIVIVLGSFIKMSLMKLDYNKEKLNYEAQIDSIKVADLELTSKVFSWAVRSELMRNNTEQVNQFFLAFIKENQFVQKLDLVDPNSAKIILSTDKKTEGDIYSNKDIMTINKTTYREGLIISPIMGLDSKIGILIIDVNN